MPGGERQAVPCEPSVASGALLTVSASSSPLLFRIPITWKLSFPSKCREEGHPFNSFKQTFNLQLTLNELTLIMPRGNHSLP